MRIKSIKIEKLFEIFDYQIEYPQGENILILTGPNGFGKTKILNIIFSLFNRKFQFFEDLVFEKIIVFLEDDLSIGLQKMNEKLIISLWEKEIEYDRFDLSFIPPKETMQEKDIA